jgi:type II secretory pathway pseudopilin PulG
MKPVAKVQRGAALVVALLILIVITVLSIAAMRNSTMQLRMAINEQQRGEAFQSAQAAIEHVVAKAKDQVGRGKYFPVIGTTGYKICTANVSGCNAYPDPPPVPTTSPQCPPSTPPPFCAANSVKIERLEPDLRPPPRGTETSIDKYDVATFGIDSRFDKSSQGQGQAELIQGFIVLVPKAS